MVPGFEGLCTEREACARLNGLVCGFCLPRRKMPVFCWILDGLDGVQTTFARIQHKKPERKAFKPSVQASRVGRQRVERRRVVEGLPARLSTHRVCSPVRLQARAGTLVTRRVVGKREYAPRFLEGSSTSLAIRRGLLQLIEFTLAGNTTTPSGVGKGKQTGGGV